MLVIMVELSLMLVSATALDDIKTIDLRMPNIQPDISDVYICRGIKLGPEESYITGFVPDIKMTTAHHMLVVGCSKPGESKPTWRCRWGPYHRKGPICARGERVLYSWGRDAPPLYLPNDVAFRVGGNTGTRYLVMEIHYGNVSAFLPPENRRDNSGVQIITQTKRVRYEAGIILLGATGRLSPRSTVYMESAFRYMEDVDFHPLLYRVHTHELGKVVSSYRIRDGQWTEIGRENPLKVQMFYHTTTPGMTVRAGDILAVRCTMYNINNYTVYYGFLEEQEMCLLYIMYFVEGHKLIRNSILFSPGPPKWSWKDFPGDDLDLQNIPEEVSTAPGSDLLFEKPKTAINRDFLEQLGINNLKKNFP